MPPPLDSETEGGAREGHGRSSQGQLPRKGGGESARGIVAGGRATRESSIAEIHPGLRLPLRDGTGSRVPGHQTGRLTVIGRGRVETRNGAVATPTGYRSNERTSIRGRHSRSRGGQAATLTPEASMASCREPLRRVAQPISVTSTSPRYIEVPTSRNHVTPGSLRKLRDGWIRIRTGEPVRLVAVLRGLRSSSDRQRPADRLQTGNQTGFPCSRAGFGVL